MLRLAKKVMIEYKIPLVMVVTWIALQTDKQS